MSGYRGFGSRPRGSGSRSRGFGSGGSRGSGSGSGFRGFGSDSRGSGGSGSGGFGSGSRGFGSEDITHFTPYEIGRDYLNLRAEIPDIYRSVSNEIRPGEPDVDEPTIVKLIDHLPTLKAQWSCEKPPAERIDLLRDLIMQSYNQARASEIRKSPTGHFVYEDVEFWDGEIRIVRFHNSKHYLGQSIEVVMDELLKVPPQFQDAYRTHILYQDFLSRIRNCQSARELAMLYFHPFLRTEREITYFVLDIALLADLDKNLKYVIGKNFGQDVKPICERIENSQHLIVKGQQFKDSFEGALNFAKMVAHHYNEYVWTNLPLDEVMKKYFKEFPSLPLNIFTLLVDASFDFTVFMEDVNA